MPDDDEKALARPTLRVVSDAFPQAEEVGSTFQLGLFPKSDPLALSFFHVSFLKSNGLIASTAEIAPGLFVDVRAVPSFRVLGLEREIALSFFENRSVSYVDVAGLLGAKRLSLGTSSLVAQFVAGLFSGVALSRPAMLLFDDFQLMSVMAEQLTGLLRQRLRMNFNAQVFTGRSGVPSSAVPSS